MQTEKLSALIEKTATLLVQYERCSALIDARPQSLGEALQSRAQQLPAAARAGLGESMAM